MARLFKKPDFRKSSIDISETAFRDIQSLDDIKKQVKPEVYLQTLYAKIEEKEREIIEVEDLYKTKTQKAKDAFGEEYIRLRKEIKDLEEILIFKREERTQLERPLDERQKALQHREDSLNVKEKDIQNKEIDLYQREQACESQLSAIRDISDELGEMRLQFTVKIKKLDAREDEVAHREMIQLATSANWKEYEIQQRNSLKERWNEIELKELNIQSKEENIAKREEALLKEKLLVQSQRQALLAAQKDGSTKRPQR